MFSGHSEVKLEIHRRKFQECTMWKLDNTLLNTQWGKGEIVSKMAKYLERNENGNKAHPPLLSHNHRFVLCIYTLREFCLFVRVWSVGLFAWYFCGHILCQYRSYEFVWDMPLLLSLSIYYLTLTNANLWICCCSKFSPEDVKPCIVLKRKSAAGLLL